MLSSTREFFKSIKTARHSQSQVLCRHCGCYNHFFSFVSAMSPSNFQKWDISVWHGGRTINNKAGNQTLLAHKKTKSAPGFLTLRSWCCFCFLLFFFDFPVAKAPGFFIAVRKNPNAVRFSPSRGRKGAVDLQQYLSNTWKIQRSVYTWPWLQWS